MKNTPDQFAVLVAKGGIDRFAATSSSAGKLDHGPAKLDLRNVRPQSETDRSRAAAAYAPQKRIQEGQRYTVVAGRRGETLQVDLAGRGGAGEILVVGPAGVTRAAYPAGKWASRIELRSDGSLRTRSGTPLTPTSKPAAGATAQAPTASGVIGGACTYRDISGNARIIRIEKTEASRKQASTHGGPGYEGYEVEFLFTPASPIAEKEPREFAARAHLLQLANSWFPGGNYLRKYRIVTGATMPATLRVRTSGACTPMIFAFPGIDLADYFETRR
jgi:hypothetical protein